MKDFSGYLKRDDDIWEDGMEENKEVDELARFMWASWGGSDPDCSWATLDEAYKFKWKAQAELLIDKGYTRHAPNAAEEKLVPALY